MAANISKVNGLDLSAESDQELEDLLKNELYMNIHSEFAMEISAELESRGQEKE